MTRVNKATRCLVVDGADRQTALSRRRLLVSGAGAMAFALPIFGRDLRIDDSSLPDTAGEREIRADRRQRLAAVLDRYGPELGSRR